jgi:hypothetical protein
MRPPDVSFEGVTKIVFTRTHFEEPRPSGKDGKPLREGAKTTIVIVDKVEIARLTKLIVLRPKAVCGCMHLDEVTFEKGKSRINVHFCDHCFDIGNVSYRMPGAFHAAYQKLLAAHFAKATK